jgi:hypothetical protein
MLLTREGKIQEGKPSQNIVTSKNGLIKKEAQQMRVPTKEWMMDNSLRMQQWLKKKERCWA